MIAKLTTDYGKVFEMGEDRVWTCAGDPEFAKFLNENFKPTGSPDSPLAGDAISAAAAAFNATIERPPRPWTYDPPGRIS